MILRNWIKDHQLSAFFAFSFAIAWAIWIPVGAFAPDLLTLLGLLGAWAPTASAIIVSKTIDGNAGVITLLRSGLKWRVGIQWYAIALFSVALVAAATTTLHNLLSDPISRIAPFRRDASEPLLTVLPVLFLFNIFIGGPIAEEFGWRGFALPRIQVRMKAFYASLVLGVIWAFWHLPFFLVPEAASVVGHVPFGWYVPLLAGWSVLFGWVYNNANGSVLLMVLFHAAFNTTLGSLNLLQVDAFGTQPLALYVLFTWLLVAIVLAVFGFSLRRRMPKKPGDTR